MVVRAETGRRERMMMIWLRPTVKGGYTRPFWTAE